MELNWVPSARFSVKGGFTIQSSKYENPQEFDERKFFRTPNDYGYIVLDWAPYKKLGISSSGVYTGTMLIPYFGPEIPGHEEGELTDQLFVGFKKDPYTGIFLRTGPIINPDASSQ